MLRMCESGLISLPPSRGLNGNPKMEIRFTEETAEKPCLKTPAGHLTDLRFDLVSGKKQSSLWNEYIHRYHYLGCKRLPGAQLRYMVRNGNDMPALPGFGAAAWKTAPRDRFIGWNDRQRQNKLNLIVNNSRFPVLPWASSKNLASRILGGIAKRLPRIGIRSTTFNRFYWRHSSNPANTKGHATKRPTGFPSGGPKAEESLATIRQAYRKRMFYFTLYAEISNKSCCRSRLR